MKKICLLATLILSQNVFADDLVQWWDVSATVLHGENYDLAPSERQTTITLETAGGWKYGDWFVFQDFINFNGNNNGVDSTTYGEISPRFSASKILGQPVGFGAIKDVSLALTFEEGEGPVNSMLYGIGLDIDVPFFSYLQLNTYRRDAIGNSPRYLESTCLSVMPISLLMVLLIGYFLPTITAMTKTYTLIRKSNMT